MSNFWQITSIASLPYRDTNSQSPPPWMLTLLSRVLMPSRSLAGFLGFRKRRAECRAIGHANSTPESRELVIGHVTRSLGTWHEIPICKWSLLSNPGNIFCALDAPVISLPERRASTRSTSPRNLMLRERRKKLSLL